MRRKSLLHVPTIITIVTAYALYYNRYRAYIQAKKDKSSWKGMQVVPQINSTQHKENSLNCTTASHREEDYCDSHHFYHQPTTSLVEELPLPALDSEIEHFPSIQPELVYLCHRGYNHCVGKLSSRSVIK